MAPVGQADHHDLVESDSTTNFRNGDTKLTTAQNNSKMSFKTSTS